MYSVSESVSSPVNYLEDLKGKFGWPEYVVFSIVLLLSSGIGIFYGFFSKREQNKEEFLMGSRTMSAWPVALSLLCSFISAIAMLGNPMEVYLYGTQYLTVLISFFPMTLALLYIYAPVYFKLQLTSAFEYFELRFSRSVRVLVSLINCFYLLMYMSLVVYGPSLALNQVTGFNTNLSVAVIFIICIFYSSLGGFRAVLMTDALQGIIMIGSLAAINIKGVSDVGGFENIWKNFEATGRVEFFRFDVDPRTRHSVWSIVFGGFFMYLTFFAGTQANIQRYSSMPNMKTVRRALIINYVALTITIGLILLSGMILLTKYYDCDPLSAKLIKASDQLIPFFVMEILGDFPGLPGIFVAGITCASLSSVSSGLNALAAVVTEDYVKRLKPDATDSFLLVVSRVTSVVSGLISFGFVFIAQNMGNIYPAAISLAGMLLGPTTGIFTLGILFPWANSRGALLGVVSSYLLSGVLAIGSSIANGRNELPDQTLSLSTLNCSEYLFGEELENVKSLNHSYAPGDYWKERSEGDTAYIKFISTSYLLFPLIGVIGTVLFGLIFSAAISLAGFNSDKPVLLDCLNEHFVTFWKWGFPNEMERLLEQKLIENKESKSLQNYLK